MSFVYGMMLPEKVWVHEGKMVSRGGAESPAGTTIDGQATIDAGSKAIAREEIRGTAAPGYGALLDHPDVYVKALSEEHGMLDTPGADWRPTVGEQVRIVPNHVCVSVNLQPRLWVVEGGALIGGCDVRARGWQ